MHASNVEREKGLDSAVGRHGKHFVILRRYVDVDRWSRVVPQHTCWLSGMIKEQMSIKQVGLLFLNKNAKLNLAQI
jgi:hypothetical protein